MNPAIKALAELAASDAMYQIRVLYPNGEIPDGLLSMELQVQLDLIGALMFHGVITETPEEIADIIVADFRATIQNARNMRLPGRLEKDAQRIFIRLFRMARASYVQLLKDKGCDNPDILPKVVIDDDTGAL